MATENDPSAPETIEGVQAVAELLPEAAVFVVDRERRVVSWSSGAEQLLGFSADEVVGEHCLKANRCRECIGGCGIAEHGAVRDMPLTLFRKDGSEVAVRKTARAYFDQAGAFVGGVEVLVRDQAVIPPPRMPRPDPDRRFHGIITRDPKMAEVFQIVRNVAETTTTILLRGDSGTGKELLARAIHAESAGRDGDLVSVNCAALTPSLMESELFGHVKGAFTGAISDRKGIFEQAHRGTLFLDEVAELPLNMQAKLLRVLEEREVTRVGGSKAIQLDVRVVAATHRSLRDAVENGSFREDLLYRLRVIPIFIPPLRERKSDIDLLARHFVQQFAKAGRRKVTSIAPDAMRALLNHEWPGNVRELRNVIEYAFAVGRGPELLLAELPPEFAPKPPDQRTPISGALADEAKRVKRALADAEGNLAAAATILGVSRATLWRQRKKHGL